MLFNSMGLLFRHATFNSGNAFSCLFRLQTKSLRTIWPVRKHAFQSSVYCLSKPIQLTLIRNIINRTCIRGFRLTAPRYANPIIWIVLRPLIKILAALTGRGFRKWWKNLPPDKKKYFLKVMKKNRMKIFTVMTAVGLLSYAYYYTHLEETPLTKRIRFMAFNADQFKIIGEAELNNILQQFHDQVLPPFHPYTKRVAVVVNQILRSNKDIKELQEKTFAISVINSPMENAFVLPNGEIFVFAGMLNLCSNNDQLGVVLAHEISHCILAHGAENFNFTHLVDFAMVILIALIWAILPSDFLSAVIHYLAKQSVDLLLHLPYNRKIETEADEVGLGLAAKACFDVRESSAFWSKMDVLKRNYPEGSPEVEFLSTHPSHRTRASHLDSIMEKALKLRSDCGCPMLRSKDPRLEIERLAKLLEQQRKVYRHQPVVIIPPPR